jgi:uncharacterized repeat protein (TIGR03803 family)
MGCGVVFKLVRSGDSWTESVLWSFAGGSDGSFPRAEVTFDKKGNLYSTTSDTSGEGDGTVFQLSPMGNGWSKNTLYRFQGGSDGATPEAGLIFDGSGNLYGATVRGGSGGGGTIFELTPSTFTVLYSFPGVNGGGTYKSLTMDAAGNLYGTTFVDGAYGYGAVFKLTYSNGEWKYSSLHDFTGGSDGANPYSNVVFDAKGNLYGTAEAGGENGWGVVWEITP